MKFTDNINKQCINYTRFDNETKVSSQVLRVSCKSSFFSSV